MEGTVKEDIKVLVPNRKYQNFTESGEVIKKGTKVNGEPKFIQGMRNGKPYTHKLFLTDRNQLIFLHKVIPTEMEKTEVTLGANGTTTPSNAAVINLRPAQYYSHDKLIGVAAGIALGYAYARHKKVELKRSGKYLLIGALLGYGAAYLVDVHKSAQIKPGKQ